MDAFMKQIERLSDMASARSVPQPLDRAAVMARIRELAVEEDDRVLSLPLRFWAGGAAAAAAVAIAVTLFAATAWTDMGNPLTATDSLFNVMDVL